MHVTRAARPGTTVEARAQVLRAGRTTVVIEVGLHDEAERDVGIATMSFSVLPRREINPDMDSVRGGGPATMALDDSRLAGPLLNEVGVVVRDAARGVVDAPVRDWSRNSMGAMQGGVVATVVDAAAEAALRAATGEALVVTDLQLTYVGFGRVGPVRSRVEVLGTGPGHACGWVELVDVGAEDRRMTVARVAATRGLA
jgi:acyl-coenzyme A thioesterase PaaI-like protein